MIYGLQNMYCKKTNFREIIVKIMLSNIIYNIWNFHANDFKLK